MLYCSGSHKHRLVAEEGRTPYLQCRVCGKAELIPGAGEDESGMSAQVKFDIAFMGLALLIGLLVLLVKYT